MYLKLHVYMLKKKYPFDYFPYLFNKLRQHYCTYLKHLAKLLQYPYFNFVLITLIIYLIWVMPNSTIVTTTMMTSIFAIVILFLFSISKWSACKTLKFNTSFKKWFLFWNSSRNGNLQIREISFKPLFYWCLNSGIKMVVGSKNNLPWKNLSISSLFAYLVSLDYRKPLQLDQEQK